jgi:hypothetical protein
LLWLFIIEFRWGTAGAVLAFDITSWGIALAEKIIRQTIFFPCQNWQLLDKIIFEGKKRGSYLIQWVAPPSNGPIAGASLHWSNREVAQAQAQATSD